MHASANLRNEEGLDISSGVSFHLRVGWRMKLVGIQLIVIGLVRGEARRKIRGLHIPVWYCDNQRYPR